MASRGGMLRLAMGKKLSSAETGALLATAADARLNDRSARELELILDIAKTALGDAQGRASALDAKSLAAIGFAVALLVLTSPRLGRPPAMDFDYWTAVLTSVFAVIAAVLSGLGFTLADLPRLTGDRYLPPEANVSPGYEFPSGDRADIGLLRRHIVSVHALAESLDAINASRGNYLTGAQICLIAAAVCGLLYRLNGPA